MGFTIPNVADAENANQAQVDSRDFADILALAPSLTGVLSGCAVTAQGSPDMTVAVAAGTVVVAGAGATVSAGNVTITAADATNPRFDLICVSSAGTKSAVAGTPAASPVFPNPSGKVVLAAVYVPASDTTIETAKIVDKRVMLDPFSTAGKPGVDGFIMSFLDVALGDSVTLSAGFSDSDYFYLHPLLSPVKITGLSVTVTTAGAAGKLARLGLYRADANWYPTSLVVDAGTVAIDSTGQKTATFAAISLPPGRYMSVLAHNDSGGTVLFRAVRGMTVSGFDPSSGSALCIERAISRVFAAFPDPASGTMTSPSGGSTAVTYHVSFQISEAF